MVSKYIRKNSQEEVCSLALCSKSRNRDYILITSMSMFCQMYHLGKLVLRFSTTVYQKQAFFFFFFYEKGNFLVLVTVQLSKEWWWGGFYQPYYDTKDDFESSYDSAVRSSSFLYLVLSFLVSSGFEIWMQREKKDRAISPSFVQSCWIADDDNQQQFQNPNEHFLLLNSNHLKTCSEIESIFEVVIRQGFSKRWVQ